MAANASFEIGASTSMPAASNKTEPNPPLPGFDLPELPIWLLHAAAGLLSCLFVAAVILFLAQFTTWVPWGHLKKTTTRKAGYRKLKQHDGDEDNDSDGDLLEGSHNSTLSSIKENHDNNDITNINSPDTLRKRKRKPEHLSIDTSVKYHGLGIAVPGIGGGDCDGDHRAASIATRKPVHTRRFYDAEALRVRPESPAKRVWKTLTAPLPSARTFCLSIGIGLGSLDEGEDEEVVDFVTANPYQPCEAFEAERRTDGGAGGDGGSALVTWLEKINGAIYYVTDALAKALYEHVSKPEEGLLLPVRDGETE